MSELTDRVSRAVLAEIFEKTGTMICNLDLGHVAVAAMRDPPKRILKAACGAMSPRNRPTEQWVSCKEKHRIRFNAMIDAALQ